MKDDTGTFTNGNPEILTDDILQVSYIKYVVYIII